MRPLEFIKLLLNAFFPSSRRVMFIMSVVSAAVFFLFSRKLACDLVVAAIVSEVQERYENIGTFFVFT